MGCCWSKDARRIEDDFHIVVPDNPGVNDKFVHRYEDDPDQKGQKTWTIDLRRSQGGSDGTRKRPRVSLGESWTDSRFPLSSAIRNHAQIGLEWKRPHVRL